MLLRMHKTSKNGYNKRNMQGNMEEYIGGWILRMLTNQQMMESYRKASSERRQYKKSL
jgi:hypothetical protein